MSQASENHIGWLDRRILVTLEDGLEAATPAFHLLLIGRCVMSGLKGNFDCIVGIDISKDKFDALWHNRWRGRRFFRFQRPWIGRVSKSWRNILARFRVFRFNRDGVYASYHVNLFSYLVAAWRLINPSHQFHCWFPNYVKMQLRRQRRTKKDQLSLPGFSSCQWKLPCFNGRLVLLISDLRDLSASGRVWLTRWHFWKSDQQLLNITFPELEHMVGIIYEVYSQAFAAISFRKMLLEIRTLVNCPDLDCGFLWS